MSDSIGSLLTKKENVEPPKLLPPPYSVYEVTVWEYVQKTSQKKKGKRNLEDEKPIVQFVLAIAVAAECAAKRLASYYASKMRK